MHGEGRQAMAKSSAKAGGATSGKGGLYELPKGLKLAAPSDFTSLLGKIFRIKGVDCALTLDRVKLYQPNNALPPGARTHPFSLVFKDRHTTHTPLSSGFYSGEFEGGPSLSLHLTARDTGSSSYQEYDAAFS
jgi:hypothetical protein